MLSFSLDIEQKYTTCRRIAPTGRRSEQITPLDKYIDSRSSRVLRSLGYHSETRSSHTFTEALTVRQVNTHGLDPSEGAVHLRDPRGASNSAPARASVPCQACPTEPSTSLSETRWNHARCLQPIDAWESAWRAEPWLRRLHRVVTSPIDGSRRPFVLAMFGPPSHWDNSGSISSLSELDLSCRRQKRSTSDASAAYPS